MKQESVTAEARRLERVGDHGAALSLLGDALRKGQLGADEWSVVGRQVNRLLRSSAAQQNPLRILVLGQCTTTWFAQGLASSAWGQQVPCLVEEGPFDNVVQVLEAMSTTSPPNVLVLLPWSQHLLSGQERAPDVLAAEALDFWKRAWRLASQKGIKRLIQIGYDWIFPGALGYHLSASPGGDIDLVRRLNAELRAAMPAESYFVPLEELSGTLGRSQFYDLRRMYWTKQPFSEAGLMNLSEHVIAGLRALTSGPRKVLVLDLDNTLWGGVVGETGPLGVELGDSPRGEAFRQFQRHVKALTRRGVLLAVCSKNNAEDARECFRQNPDMVLKLDDFAHFVANWEPKTTGLREIAETLRLGLDSFVFFDDSPFEREMVRQAMPDVAVVDVPEDPSDYVRALQEGLWFESCVLTDEDKKRSHLYRAEVAHRAARNDAGGLDDYLASLDMQATVRPIDTTDMQRIVQLLGKTNQFNLTTRRHTTEALRELLSRPGSIGLSLRLEDRLSDHGLVAVVLGVKVPLAGVSAMEIDSFLMSCRVIGRTVEAHLLQSLIDVADVAGYQRVIGRYLPTPKNHLVASFFEQMGFAHIAPDDRAGECFELKLPAADRLQSKVIEKG